MSRDQYNKLAGSNKELTRRKEEEEEEEEETALERMKALTSSRRNQQTQSLPEDGFLSFFEGCKKNRCGTR